MSSGFHTSDPSGWLLGSFGILTGADTLRAIPGVQLRPLLRQRFNSPILRKFSAVIHPDLPLSGALIPSVKTNIKLEFMET